MNEVIACDPGTKYCAFAIYKRGKLTKYSKIKPTLPNLQDFFKSYLNNNFTFVVEDQYLNLNVHTLIKLVSIRSMLITLARIYNCSKCITVSPQRWQTVILGIHIKAKREQRKRVSCLVASQIAKQEIKDNDVADAICIGEYVIRKKKWSKE